jgi:fucose 4-O-acetylase-like acetyltransferase
MQLNDPLPLPSKRLAWLDIAKGLGIALIVLGHHPLLATTPAGREVWRWVFTFHVPLFFLLAGYVFRLRPDTSFRQLARKRFRSLVAPALTLIALGEVARALHISERLDAGHMFVGAFVFSTVDRLYWMAAPAWFLLCLFITQWAAAAILLWIGRLTKSKRCWLMGACVGVLLLGPAFAHWPTHTVLFWPWNSGLLPYALPFFLLGHGVAWTHGDGGPTHDSSAPESHRGLLLGGGVQAVAWCVVFVVTNLTARPVVDIAWGTYAPALPATLAALSGSLMLMNLSIWLSTWGRFQWLQTLGKFTMPILLLHLVMEVKVYSLVTAWVPGVLAAGCVSFLAGLWMPALMGHVYGGMRRRLMGQRASIHNE